jgi:hypothetical protein
MSQAGGESRVYAGSIAEAEDAGLHGLQEEDMSQRLLAHVRNQWMGALALFIALAGGGAYAAQQIGSDDIERSAILSRHIKNGQVHTADLGDGAVDSQAVENHSLLSQDFAAGQLPAGPPGPQGDQGVPGTPGSGAAPTIQGFAGDAGNGGNGVAIPAGTAWKMIGPTTTFSAAAGDRITGIATVPLFYNGAGNTTINLDLCYQPTAGGTAVNFNGTNYQQTTLPQPNTASTIFTGTGSVVMAPGSWDVGLCARNYNATAFTMGADFVNGWAMLTH